MESHNLRFSAVAWFDGLPHDYGEMVWRKIGNDLVWMFLPETWTIEQDDDLFWACYEARRPEAEDWGAFRIGLTFMDLFEPTDEEMLAAERDGVVSATCIAASLSLKR